MAFTGNKQSRTAKLRQLYIRSVDTYDGRLADGKIPSENLVAIKRDIRRRIAKQRMQMFVWAFVFFMMVLALVWGMLWISK